MLDEEETYNELAAVALVPWPRRAWVQQEVFAARELTLYYGRCEMSLDHYFGLLEQLCKSPVKGRLEELERQRKVLASLCHLRRYEAEPAGTRKTAECEARALRIFPRERRVQAQKGRASCVSIQRDSSRARLVTQSPS